MLSVLGDFLIWANIENVSRLNSWLLVAFGLSLTFMLMVLVWDIFVPIGRLLGRLLDDHPSTIWAYSVNVAGSLVGIWLFVLLSAFDLPPVSWFAVVAALFVMLIGPDLRSLARRFDLCMVAVLVMLTWFACREPGATAVWWSPYQKIVVTERVPNESDGDAAERYFMTVNNTEYQGMLDLSEANVAANPGKFPVALRGLSQYDLPYLLHPGARTSLIVGAGTGNDAAGALRHRVERITAVEIDPAIIALGRRFHPEHPYDSGRTKVVNDDARSFFATTADRYDVISFGLLDSHTTTSMTNARLDHYVYTKESLRRARELLADGGVMVLSFEAQKPYIADRMATALEMIFGEPPIVFGIPQSVLGWGGVVFVAGDLEAVRRQIASNPRLAHQIELWRRDRPVDLSGTTRITTDDWPYIYLEKAAIPNLYFLLGGLLLLLLLVGVRRAKIDNLASGWNEDHWHFFFLGAAFLLLEVQNISKASVVLGNTWTVNAVIISGILALALLANLVVAKAPAVPSWLVYGGLCGSCLGLYFVDLSRFGFLPYATKAAIVGGLTSLPMFFSGIVFIRSFSAVAEKDKALGANLFGALAGGLLQSLTFVTGIKALLLMVAGLYMAALMTRPRSPRRVSAEEPGRALVGGLLQQTTIAPWKAGRCVQLPSVSTLQEADASE